MARYMERVEDPRQLWLEARCLDDLVAEGSDVRVVSAAIDMLDLSELEMSYGATGRPAYPPEVMLKVLVYAYSRKECSSRRIEELLESDVRYMWLAGNLRPDFRTVSRF